MRLPLLLDMAADGFGQRVLAGRKSGGMTAAQLAKRSHSGAGLVRERAAEAVVYLDVNGPAFPVALFAAARAGVPLVPLNYRLGQRQLGTQRPSSFTPAAALLSSWCPQRRQNRADQGRRSSARAPGRG